MQPKAMLFDEPTSALDLELTGEAPEQFFENPADARTRQFLERVR